MSASPRLITTPEHVQIQLRPAGVGNRFLALVVDATLVLCTIALAAKVVDLVVPQALSAGLIVSIGFVIKWSYHVFFETQRNGQTPGKRATGLRVVDGRGLPITIPQSFIRNIVRVIDFLPVGYGLGAIVALVDPQHRRLGDLAADTLVIHEPRDTAYVAQLVRGRQYNSLQSARTQRLVRHRITLAEREFLLALCLRADRLDAAARYDLMERVGDHYRGVLAIDDPHLSGENLVRGLTALLHAPRRS